MKTKEEVERGLLMDKTGGDEELLLASSEDGIRFLAQVGKSSQNSLGRDDERHAADLRPGLKAMP